MNNSVKQSLKHGQAWMSGVIGLKLMIAGWTRNLTFTSAKHLTMPTSRMWEIIWCKWLLTSQYRKCKLYFPISFFCSCIKFPLLWLIKCYQGDRGHSETIHNPTPLIQCALLSLTNSGQNVLAQIGHSPLFYCLALETERRDCRDEINRHLSASWQVVFSKMYIIKEHRTNSHYLDVRGSFSRMYKEKERAREHKSKCWIKLWSWALDQCFCISSFHIHNHRVELDSKWPLIKLIQ